MNARKKLTKVLKKIGLTFELRDLDGGKTALECSGTTYVFDGETLVSATSTAAHKRWAKKQEKNGAQE